MPRGFMDDLGGFVGGERIGKVSESRFNVVSECIPALVRNGDEAFSIVQGVYTPTHRESP